MSYERTQGQRYALEMLQSVDGTPKIMCAESPLKDVARNLFETSKKRPAEFAQGIRDILFRVKDLL